MNEHLISAVRKAIADGIDPAEVAETVRELTEDYAKYDNPAAIAAEDLLGE